MHQTRKNPELSHCLMMKGARIKVLMWPLVRTQIKCSLRKRWSRLTSCKGTIQHQSSGHQTEVTAIRGWSRSLKRKRNEKTVVRMSSTGETIVNVLAGKTQTTSSFGTSSKSSNVLVTSSSAGSNHATSRVEFLIKPVRQSQNQFHRRVLLRSGRASVKFFDSASPVSTY